MSYFYSITDVLDRLESLEDEETRFQALVPVAYTPPFCRGFPEDVFILSSSPKIMDLRNKAGIEQFTRLVEDAPLYGINLELILDQALSERHTNLRIESALNQAFGGKPLPNTMRNRGGNDEETEGSLRHPMLGHLDRGDLCELYLGFLSHLDRNRETYNFGAAIIGKQPGRFIERFDGFATESEARVKAGILLAFGMRADHDPGKTLEEHMQEGRKAAQSIDSADVRETIWAWLEADQYQMRRCEEIDRVMNLNGLPRIPNWVRTDVMCCIEKEAMKQVFAASLMRSEQAQEILSHTESLCEAIGLGAEGKMDEMIELLLSQTLSQGVPYTGAARTFVDQAKIRMAEAGAAKLN